MSLPAAVCLLSVVASTAPRSDVISFKMQAAVSDPAKPIPTKEIRKMKSGKFNLNILCVPIIGLFFQWSQADSILGNTIYELIRLSRKDQVFLPRALKTPESDSKAADHFFVSSARSFLYA